MATNAQWTVVFDDKMVIKQTFGLFNMELLIQVIPWNTEMKLLTLLGKQLV